MQRIVSTIALLFLPFSISAAELTFPDGTATPPEACAVCHKAIYREFRYGFGSDTAFGPMQSGEGLLRLPASVSTGATAHSISGIDPFPIHARGAEEGGKSCNACHFPEVLAFPNATTSSVGKPAARNSATESAGITCATCHLTADGLVRGPFDVRGPHRTVQAPEMMTSRACAPCHSLGTRVAGRQTQTYLEWREDFYKAGLGNHQCQDCHMPRTLRKVAEDYDVPVRAVARHLWTGGRSSQRLQGALTLAAVQPAPGKAMMEFHVINIGAGHSVPTGSNRRAVFLTVEAVDREGRKAAEKEWMFAPWYGSRADDRKYLEEDRERPDAIAAAQADAQGPHETIIRAGEERVLAWTPDLKPGTYTIRARLVYDLNRYNDPGFAGDRTTMFGTSLTATVNPARGNVTGKRRA